MWSIICLYWYKISRGYTVLKRSPQTITTDRDPRFKQVTLSHGVVNYCIDGDTAEGRKRPLVVLLPGFAGSCSYFQWLNAALVRNGCRVLRYDMYGRGHTSCPDVPMTGELLAGQTAELLYKLNEFGKVHVVGYSMGGAVALHFAAAYPDKCESLSMLAPAGMSSIRAHAFPPPAILCLIQYAPIFVQEWLALKLIVAKLGSPGEFNSQSFSHYQAFQNDMRNRGVRERSTLPVALASTIRHFPMGEW